MGASPLSDEQTLGLIREVLVHGQGNALRLLQEVARIVVRHQYAQTCQWVGQTGGMKVLSGPLTGLKYLPASSGSLLPPKLVGSYESELHPTLERIIASPYNRLIDIGCAEGYYAVGLALRMPALQVYAFDIDARARDLCRKMADLNGVADRLILAAECSHITLQELGTLGTLLICDIEGGELDLLDLVRAPALAACDLLVECHDFLGQSISTELANRFHDTHMVEVIPNTWTNPNERPFLLGLRPIQKFFAVWEGRPGLTPWLFMTSHRRKCGPDVRHVQVGGRTA